MNVHVSDAAEVETSDLRATRDERLCFGNCGVCARITRQWEGVHNVMT